MGKWANIVKKLKRKTKYSTNTKFSLEDLQIMNILYSTGCPKCKVLETKLNNKNVSYNVVTDVNEMLNKGIKSAPVLEVDGNVMDFASAVKWVNQIEN